MSQKTKIKKKDNDATNDYICPRCGLSTEYKGNMRQHFERKSLCKNRHNLLLTEEIKEIVLRDRVYHKPKDKGKTSITQNNIMINFVVKLDTTDKLTKLLEYTGKNLIEFKTYAWQMFYNDMMKLENGTNDNTSPILLDRSTILQSINKVTQTSHNEYDKINSLFDHKTKRINLYFAKMWNSYLASDGINAIINIMVENYYMYYELYLIKKMFNPEIDAFTYNLLKSHLEEYYTFIATFDISPYITDMTDVELIGQQLKENNAHYISEQCFNFYKSQKDALSESHIKNTKRELTDILKGNTVNKTEELNKTIVHLMRTDQQFQQFFKQSTNI